MTIRNISDIGARVPDSYRPPLTSDQIARGCRYVGGQMVCASDGAGGELWSYARPAGIAAGAQADLSNPLTRFLGMNAIAGDESSGGILPPGTIAQGVANLRSIGRSETDPDAGFLDIITSSFGAVGGGLLNGLLSLVPWWVWAIGGFLILWLIFR